MLPGFDHQLILLSQTLILYGVLMIVERVHPVEHEQSRASATFNVAWTIIATMLAYWSIRCIDAVLVLPMLPPVLTIETPTTWHARFGCELLFLLIYDFFAYWLHRLQHTIPAFWAIHRLHHSDEHVNVTTTGRHHWLEQSLRVLFVLAPMVILFDIPSDIASFGIALAVLIPMFSHMNLKLNLGPLSCLIVGPQLHRIHHSAASEHADKNFANVFPVWDIVFGTYYHPKRDQFPKTGLLETRTDAAVVISSCLEPFRFSPSTRNQARLVPAWSSWFRRRPSA